MNDEGMLKVLAIMAALWPQADVERRYAVGLSLVVSDLDADDVIEALKFLAVGEYPVSSPREFPPPPGVIRGRVETMRRDRRRQDRIERRGITDGA